MMKKIFKLIGRILTGPHVIRHVIMLFFQFAVFYRISNKSINPVGNYFIDFDKISPGSIVYSFGIADNIKFDEAIFELTNSPIYCFDPTPQSIVFMKQYSHDRRFTFIPKGVNDRRGRFKLFQSTNPNKINSSLFDIHGTGKFVYVECDTIWGFMKALGHTYIDILKLDVEGVAVRVLNHMLDSPVRPKQIVVEFEIINIAPLFYSLHAIYRVVKRLRCEGYKAYSINPLRKATIEGLFVMEHCEHAKT